MNLFNIFKKKTIELGTGSTALDMLFFKSGANDLSFSSGKALSYYEKSVYVNKAIEKRAEKVSEVKLYLEDKKEEKITDHDLLDLLAKPNNFQTGQQFFALWQKYYDLYGEVYILILKDQEFLGNKKFELRLLDPRECSPNFDINWKLDSINYKGQQKKYKAEEIIYDYRISPRNQFRGISLLKAGSYTIDTNISLDKLNYNLVEAGGKVEGIINFKGESVTVQQIKEFKAKYKEQLKEMSENGNVVFMGGDANYQRVNLTPEELGYIQTKKMSLNDICILTDVPKILLNSVDDIKYDNADASIKVFLTETIIPLIKQKVDKLNEKLELIPKELTLKFVDPTPEDTEKILKINESGAKNYYLTPNEMRANIGYDPIDGGDDILVPFNMMAQTPKEKGLKKKDFKHPLRDYDFRRAYFKKRIIMQDKQESVFIKKLNKYFKGQSERLIDEIGGKEKTLLDSSFNIKREVSIGITDLLPLLTEYLKDSGKTAIELAGGEYAFILSQEIKASLQERAELFMTSVNETTFAKLNTEFETSLELGENRNDLIKRIEDTYGNISKGRAKVIARTEVHSAVQSGTLEGYKQANMPIKIWVAVMDSRTRDSHAMLDGEEKPIDMPFSNGLMMPGDPKGWAEETVNCRCQI